jgi:tetratricopeptide (TPR) repeat protein
MTRQFYSLVFAIALAGQSSANFDTLVRDADSARDAGKMERAVTRYQQALHLKPDWKEGWWVLGSILYDSNHYLEGEEAFLPLTVLDPQNSAGWAMAGLCEFETKHYQDALAHLQKATRLGLPESLYDVTQYHIALILIRVGEFDPALELISRYAARGADNPKLVEAMGIAALRRHILPSELTPGDRDLVMALGRAMCDAAASHGKDATNEFEAIIAKYPKVPQLHYLEGLVFLQSDADKALAAFQQELILSPKHPQALISIAAEYVKQNEYQTALPFAEKAAACDPHYFATHAMLGKVLTEGNLDPPRGVKELETAVKMAPENPQSRLALASAYAKAGRKQDAATQRAEFLRLRNQKDESSAGAK